eukprot:1122574-Alexandrium_andersonii.AAC.1
MKVSSSFRRGLKARSRARRQLLTRREVAMELGRQRVAQLAQVVQAFPPAKLLGGVHGAAEQLADLKEVHQELV